MNLDGKERAWIFSDGSGLNGYAGGWSTNLIEGQHNIKVIVLKDSVSADTTFLHKTKPLYIGVNYFRSERKLTFTFSDSAFKYPFGSVLANHSLKLTENTARDFAARK